MSRRDTMDPKLFTPAGVTVSASFDIVDAETSTSLNIHTVTSEAQISTSSDLVQLSPSYRRSGERSSHDSCSTQFTGTHQCPQNDLNDTVFIVNNLAGCDEDVRGLKELFEKKNYNVHILPSPETYQSLSESIHKCHVNTEGSMIIFLYGYGYSEYLYIGKSNNESVSVKHFCEMFSNKRKRGNALVLVTNICFKAKCRHTASHRTLQNPLKDTYHMCVRVNGDCAKGSLLTDAFIHEFEDDSELFEFSRIVFLKIKSLQKEEKDIYLSDVRCYGVKAAFHFKSKLQTKGKTLSAVRKQEPLNVSKQLGQLSLEDKSSQPSREKDTPENAAAEKRDSLMQGSMIDKQLNDDEIAQGLGHMNDFINGTSEGMRETLIRCCIQIAKMSCEDIRSKTIINNLLLHMKSKNQCYGKMQWTTHTLKIVMTLWETKPDILRGISTIPEICWEMHKMLCETLSQQLYEEEYVYTISQENKFQSMITCLGKEALITLAKGNDTLLSSASVDRLVYVCKSQCLPANLVFDIFLNKSVSPTSTERVNFPSVDLQYFWAALNILITTKAETSVNIFCEEKSLKFPLIDILRELSIQENTLLGVLSMVMAQIQICSTTAEKQNLEFLTWIFEWLQFLEKLSLDRNMAEKVNEGCRILEYVIRDDILEKCISLLYKGGTEIRLLGKMKLNIKIKEKINSATKLLHILQNNEILVRDVHIQAYPWQIEAPSKFAEALNFQFSRGSIESYCGPTFEGMTVPDSLKRVCVFVDTLQSSTTSYLSRTIKRTNLLSYFAIVVSGQKVPQESLDQMAISQHARETIEGGPRENTFRERGKEETRMEKVISKMEERDYDKLDWEKSRLSSEKYRHMTQSENTFHEELYICDITSTSSAKKMADSIKELQSAYKHRIFNAIYIYNATLSSDDMLNFVLNMKGVGVITIVFPKNCQPHPYFASALRQAAKDEIGCLLSWKEITIGEPIHLDHDAYDVCQILLDQYTKFLIPLTYKAIFTEDAEKLKKSSSEKVCESSEEETLPWEFGTVGPSGKEA